MTHKCGFLEYNKGKKENGLVAKYFLQEGQNSLGSALSSNIRIYLKNPSEGPIACSIHVKNDGLASLENIGKFPIFLNGKLVKTLQGLKSGDKISIDGKEIRYIKDNSGKKMDRSRRVTMNPSLKIHSVSQIPIPTKNMGKTTTRRTCTPTKSKQIDVRRSCRTAQSFKKIKSRLNDWESANTSPISTSSPRKKQDLGITVRKSLFLKNKSDMFKIEKRRKSVRNVTTLVKNDTSMPNISQISEPDFITNTSLKTPRGVKRAYQSNSGSVVHFHKKRKHSENVVVFNLSLSGGSDLSGLISTSDEETTITSFDSDSMQKSLSREHSWIDLSELSTKSFQKSTPTMNAISTPIEKKKKSRTPKSPANDLSNFSGSRILLKTPKSPKNDLRNVSKVEKLLRTSKSPKNEKRDSQSLKKKMTTPKVHKSPLNDLSNVKGVKILMRTPKNMKSPKNDLTNVEGVNRLFRSPKNPKVYKSPVNDLTNVKGVKALMKTPKIVKSPKNDLTNVEGVKRLLRSSRNPRVQNSPLNDLTNIKGVKALMKTPRNVKSPKNDLTNVEGVKRLFRSPKNPKVYKSPVNDLTNVKGVKALMKTPKIVKSPKNDLTNVEGVKRLLRSQKKQKSPKNDLRNILGVKKLLKTPKVQKSPRNDLSDIRGMKKLLSTPKVQKSPRNDLMNVSGVKKLLKTPKSPKNDLNNFECVVELLKTPEIVKSMKNNLSNVSDTAKLLQSPLEDMKPKRVLRTRKNTKQVEEVIKSSSPPKKERRRRNNTLEKSLFSPEMATSPPKRVRGRKKTAEEMEVKSPKKRNLRSKKSKNDEVIEEKPAKRGGRRKKVEEETKVEAPKRVTRKRKAEAEMVDEIVREKKNLEKPLLPNKKSISEVVVEKKYNTRQRR